MNGRVYTGAHQDRPDFRIFSGLAGQSSIALSHAHTRLY